jgi:hypothetical protein
MIRACCDSKQTVPPLFNAPFAFVALISHYRYMTHEFQRATLGQRQNGILDRKTLTKQTRRNKLQFHPAKKCTSKVEQQVHLDGRSPRQQHRWHCWRFQPRLYAQGCRNWNKWRKGQTSKLIKLTGDITGRRALHSVYIKARLHVAFCSCCNVVSGEHHGSIIKVPWRMEWN